MKLYAANVSRHEQMLWYRITRFNGGAAAHHTVPMGQQNVVLGTEMDEADVNQFMAQMERYGGIHMDDAAGYDKKVSVLFSINEPVPLALMRKHIDINNGILTEEGETRRIEMAVVDSQSIANIQTGAGRTMDLSIEESEPGTITRQNGASPLGEGFSMPESDMAKRGARAMEPRKRRR